MENLWFCRSALDGRSALMHPSVLELLEHLLEINPATRISAEDALSLEFFHLDFGAQATDATDLHESSAYASNRDSMQSE